MPALRAFASMSSVRLGPALSPQLDFSVPIGWAGVAHGRRHLARHAFSKELIEGVNERTGGVPLFVEEVTRLLVERGELSISWSGKRNFVGRDWRAISAAECGERPKSGWHLFKRSAIHAL